MRRAAASDREHRRRENDQRHRRALEAVGGRGRPDGPRRGRVALRSAMKLMDEAGRDAVLRGNAEAFFRLGVGSPA